MNREADIRRRKQEPVELESQLILRVPEDVATKIHKVIDDPTLKEKMFIKIENDMRKVKLQFDDEVLHGKVVDLPTIIECMKTIDKKNFYKTADIVQMLVCEKGEEPPPEEESGDKPRKKDPNKVDKKFLWPHGVTPPLKNVRKRRFRKTLRKKYHDAPEVEKEVKRLLRFDLEAVSVKYEILPEDDDPKEKTSKVKTEPASLSQPGGSQQSFYQEDSSSRIEPADIEDSSSNLIKPEIGEHDIFGEALSDSDDDDALPSVQAAPSNAGLTDDDSRLSLDDNASLGKLIKDDVKHSPTPPRSKLSFEGQGLSSLSPAKSSPGVSGGVAAASPRDRRALIDRIEQLQRELTDLAVKRNTQESNLAMVENTMLKQKFQHILDTIAQEEHEKEMEVAELRERLNLIS